MPNTTVPLGLLGPVCELLCILWGHHPQELHQHPCQTVSKTQLFIFLSSVLLSHVQLVSIFPCHTERIYLRVLKLGSKLLVSWWPRHLLTYVVLVMGKGNGWIGFSHPSYCCAEGQSNIRRELEHASEILHGGSLLLQVPDSS